MHVLLVCFVLKSECNKRVCSLRRPNACIHTSRCLAHLESNRRHAAIFAHAYVSNLHMHICMYMLSSTLCNCTCKLSLPRWFRASVLSAKPEVSCLTAYAVLYAAQFVCEFWLITVGSIRLFIQNIRMNSWFYCLQMMQIANTNGVCKKTYLRTTHSCICTLAWVKIRMFFFAWYSKKLSDRPL